MHVISKMMVATALGGFIAGPVSAPAFAHETTYPHHHTYQLLPAERYQNPRPYLRDHTIHFIGKCLIQGNRKRNVGVTRHKNQHNRPTTSPV